VADRPTALGFQKLAIKDILREKKHKQKQKVQGIFQEATSN